MGLQQWFVDFSPQSLRHLSAQCACTLPRHTQTGVHNTNMTATCRLTHREDESLCPCVSMEATATSMRTLPCLDTPHPRANLRLRLLSASSPHGIPPCVRKHIGLQQWLVDFSPQSLRHLSAELHTEYEKPIHSTLDRREASPRRKLRGPKVCARLGRNANIRF